MITLGITTKMVDLGDRDNLKSRNKVETRAEGTGVDVTAGLQVAQVWHVRSEQLDVEGGEWKEATRVADVVGHVVLY